MITDATPRYFVCRPGHSESFDGAFFSVDQAMMHAVNDMGHPDRYKGEYHIIDAAGQTIKTWRAVRTRVKEWDHDYKG